MDSVKVAIRIRPLIAREQGSEILWTADTCQIKLKEGKSKPYLFDRVFNSDELTSEVYEEIVEPIVQSAMGGFNGTVFAYGQTSSGKTFTMMGDKLNPGIIPLSVKETFEHIQKTPEREFLLRVSYMEIYNEVVRDLLVPSSDGPGLQIREDEFRNTVVQGLTEKLVMSPEDVLQIMDTGNRRRHTGCTNMNERSSRSHTIFRMIIESRERGDGNTTRDSIDTDSAIKVSQLNLVDLAGSERAGQTGAEGQRFKEGCHINKSLSTLGLVINQICKASESGQSAQFISYRDSKLTRILQPSLGGNSLTAIICAVTPVSADDTDSTLRFASNAKMIKNKPHVNEVLSDEAVLYRQKREINQLKKKIHEMELNTGKKQTEELETLLQEKNKLQMEQEEKIQSLKKIILVSTQPADTLKRQRATRRETWCPGKLAAATANRSPQPWRPPRVNAALVNQSAFLEKRDETLTASELEPIASKRARFMDDPVTSSFSVAMTPSSKHKAMEASVNFVSLEEELTQMRKQQEELEEKLEEEKATKHEILQEKESLRLKVMKMQGQISLQRETLDAVLEEKNQSEEEQKTLQDKVKDQNQKIAHYMRRENQWENTNPDFRALRNENKDLCDQLRDVCAQNRKLQESNDEDRGSLDFLQVTLDEVTRDAKEKETSLEDYKQQVSVLQSQLEATFATNNTQSQTPSHDVQKLEEEFKICRQSLERKNAELEEKSREILKLQSQLNEMQNASTSGSENVDEILKTLEEQMQENHSLKIQLEEIKEKALASGTRDEARVEIPDFENLQDDISQKDAEIILLRKLLDEKAQTADADKTMNESVKVGERTFGDYLTACEALVEERDLAQAKCKSLQVDLDELRVELDELQLSKMNESQKFGEKSMMDALSACELITEEKDLADAECKKLQQQLEELQMEHDKIREDLVAMKEHDEFVQAEKEVLFEQEKEHLMEIDNLSEQIQTHKDEIEKLQKLVSESSSNTVQSSNKLDFDEEQHLEEEICNLDAQRMLQEANKELAISNTTVENQKTKLNELEKELYRVKSDLESFDTMAELTKEKYERRVQELTQQLQKAYDQISNYENSCDSSKHDASQNEEYKILLDQKETEIENLKGKLISSSFKIEELKSMVENYEKSLEESSKCQIQDGVLPDSEPSAVDRFMAEKNLTLDKLKEKLDVVASLEDEKEKILLDVRKGSERILKLEEDLKLSKDEVEVMKVRVLELKKEVSDRCMKMKELEAGPEESSSHTKLQEDLDAVRMSLQEKDSEYASLLNKLEEMKNSNNEKDDAIEQLNVELARLRKKQDDLEKEMEESVIAPSNEDEKEEEKNFREGLAKSRKELLDMTNKYNKLQCVTEHAQGALLAETNRDLDQQRLLQLAEKQRRESAIEIASERESANKQIYELHTKVNNLQTALCKANVDKDIATRRNDKITQECEFLHVQVKELENIHHKEVSVIPRGQAMDPDKMVIKIKQLSFNLELTKQTSEKLNITNTKLQDENKRLECEMVRVIHLQGEVTRLEAILEHERKMKEEQAARQKFREKESSEMRERIVQLQGTLKEMESNLEKQEREASEILKSASDDKEGVVLLKNKLASLESVIPKLRQDLVETETRAQESQKKFESLFSEVEDAKSLKVEDQKKIDHLQESLDHTLRILDREKEKSSEVEKRKEDLLSDLDRIQEDLGIKEKSRKETDERNELLQQNLDQLKKKLESAEQEVEDVRSEILNGEKLKQEELEKLLEELKMTLEKTNKERDSLQEKVDDLRKETQEMNSANDETLEKLQEELNILLQEKDSLQRKVDDLSKETLEMISANDETHKKLQEELNILLQERDSLQMKVDELMKENQTMNSANDANHKKLQEARNILLQERDSLQGKVDDLRKEIQEMNSANDETRKKLQEELNILLQERDSLQRKVDELMKENQTMNSADDENHNKLQEELNILLHERDSLQSKVDELMEENQTKNSANDETYKSLQEEHNILLQERDSFRNSLTKSEKMSEEKDVQLTKYIESFAQMKEDLQKMKSDNDSLREKVAKEEEEVESSILNMEDNLKGDEKLQEEMNYKMVLEQHNTLIQEKDCFQARIQELEIAMVLKEEEVANLEDVIVAKEEASRMLDEANEDHQKAVAEIRQILIEKEEEVKLLTDSAAEISLASSVLQKELDSLKLHLSEKVDEVEQCKIIIQDLENKCSSLQERKDSQNDDDGIGFAASLDQELIENLQDQVVELKLQLEKKNERIEDLKMCAESLSVREELAEMKQQVLDLSKSLEKEDSRTVELKRTKENVEEQHEKMKENNEILSQKIQEKDAEICKLEKDNTIQVEEFNRENKILEGKYKELLESVSSLEERITILKKDLEESSDENGKLQEEVCRLKQEYENWERERKDLQSKLEELESKETLSNETEDSKEKVSKIEEDLQHYKEKASSLDEQLNSVYEMIKEKAALMEESASSREALERDVENLREENLNLTSQLDEWEKRGNEASTESLGEGTKKMQERICQLVTEVSDLAGSRDSLMYDINDITQENKTLENEMQEAVNRIQDLEQDVADLKNERDSLKESIECKNTDAQKRALDLEEELSKMRKLKDSMESQLKEMNLEEGGNMRKAEKNIQNLTDELARMKEVKESLESQLEETKSNQEEQRREAEDKIRNLTDELARMKELKASLESQLEEMKLHQEEERREAEVKIRNLTNEVSKATELKDSLEQDLDDVRKQKTTLEERMRELDLTKEDHKSLTGELEFLKISLDSEKESAIREIKNLNKSIEKLKTTHKEEVDAIKENFSELKELKEKVYSDKKKAEKNLEKIGGLLNKKELEVQCLQTEISKWERRYEEHKSALDNAVKGAKEEISSLNEKNSLKVYELEETLLKSQEAEKDLQNKMKTFSAEQEDKLEQELEREREESKNLAKKITSIEEESTKKLESAKEKAKLDQNRLLQRIDLLEEGLFECDKELEAEKMKYEDLEKKLQESMETHERSGATRTRAGEKSALDLEAIKGACSRAESKYNEEKQKSQQLATKLKAEKRRCDELVARLEDMAVKKQTKFPGVDVSDAAKELWMERERNKTLSQKLTDSKADFSKRMKEYQEKMDATKKSMAGQISVLENNCMDSETELDDEKKKAEELEKKSKILEQKLKAKSSSSSADQNEKLKKQLEDKENQVSRLEIKLNVSIEPLQREINQLKDELKMTEERVSSLKQQLKFVPSGVEEGPNTRSAASTSRATRSSSAAGKSYRGGSGGLVVQDTKVYVLEMEIADNNCRIKFLEKELAKYKDIETKRRDENMELLEENKKFRSVIKKVREKKHSTADVLTENLSLLNQATSSTASQSKELPYSQSSQDDKCKTQ